MLLLFNIFINNIEKGMKSEGAIMKEDYYEELEKELMTLTNFVDEIISK